MTYHVISILNEGAYISVDLGFLVCRYQDGRENRIPLPDVRGVIAAHPAIAFSNAALAKLLAQDSVVLHCNRQYKPVGWSVPLDRVIRGTVFTNQLNASKTFKRDLWEQLSTAKMRNQAEILTWLGIEHSLERLIQRALPSEANVARAYWKPYLTHIGAEFGKRERQGATSFENKALNYGYAVIATLIHRSVLIHGLLPSLGIHHVYRYRSAPLVYDLMEPYRAIVDYLLAKWRLLPEIHSLKWQKMNEAEAELVFKQWIHFFMEGLRTHRLAPRDSKLTLKWLDAPDKGVRSVARCFEDSSLGALWLPTIQETYYHPETKDFADDGEEVED
jgi:CRISPR-associated protein Cas1